jgi:hypothetical protein
MTLAKLMSKLGRDDEAESFCGDLKEIQARAKQQCKNNVGPLKQTIMQLDFLATIHLRQRNLKTR